MPMPSLLRYFAVVGGALFGLLLFVNYWLEPDAAPAQQAAAPKIVVQHDPNASLIERWRDDQAAMKAAERGEPPQTAVPQGEPVVAATDPAPAPSEQPQQAEPPQVVAPASLTPAAPTEADLRAERHAKRLKAERARKARLARERARQQPLAITPEQTASRQQDQIYYAQPRPVYAYQPRPAFGPFGFGW